MNDPNDVLEHNVSSLLESGGEPPRIADTARARIRAELVAKLGAPESAPSRTRVRVPVLAAFAGLAAAAVLALVLLRAFGGGGNGALPDTDGALADGSTYVTAPGGKLTVLGPRHVRVEGAALLDVAPGQGTFTVDTERGRIEVLGTRFMVDGEVDRTTAAVVRGQVRLATTAGDVVLHAGEQAVAEAGRPPVRGPAPRLSHLVSWAREARRKSEHDLPAVHHGTLFARDPGVRSHPPWGDEYPLPITKLGVDVLVEDQVARVALDQTFRNESGENLEGVYRFAIPPDAALQRLAMYVDGKLEESAVVERMKARRVYEELVYRRVDPALLEWAGTGRLSLRVYPIPALQDKRLVMAYTQSVPKLYDDYTLTVPLPEVDQPVGELAIAMRIKGCASCEMSSTSHQITVRREGDDAVVSYDAHGDRLGDSFVLHVRDARRATTVATHRDGDERYLLVRAPAALAGRAPDYRPRTWVLLDDVSASRSPLELRAQQDLIDAFLRELDEDDRVAIVAFDVEARQKLAPTRVRDVDRKAVREALRGEGGVGATDLHAGFAAATKLLEGTAPDDAMVVYLGDGVITTGPRELDKLRAELAGKAKFVGVGVGDGPDTQTLGALAGATGGYATTIDLADDVGWRAFDLVAARHTPRATAVSARLVDAGGTPVPATVYLRSPQLADGEEIELVAKLAGAGTPAAVELTGTRDGAPWQQRIALPAGSHDGGYLPRLWAQRHIEARLLAKHEPVAVTACAGEPCPSEAQLRDKRDEEIRQEVVALGKRYFLLSRHTSLLVLENDEMYQRFGVTKGTGDTWAPYRVPATIPVQPIVASTAKAFGVDSDAELVRPPLVPFQAWSAWNYRLSLNGTIGHGFGPSLGRFGGGGGAMREPTTLNDLWFDGHAEEERQQTLGPALFSKAGYKEQDLRIDLPEGELAQPTLPVTTAETESRGHHSLVLDARVKGEDDGTLGRLVQDETIAGNYVGGESTFYLQHFASAADPAFDDLTAFAPALSRDAADAWRSALMLDAEHQASHPIDAAARDLLARARRALPAGMYRWGELEIAVDGAHRFGWRRTTEDGLAETASFDGKTWLRRYGELGIDATRAVDTDDLALALGYLPMWIAEPEHYARWFDVSAHGREVVLSRQVAGKSQPVLVLAFDDRARLVAVRDAHGATLIEITWGAAGPTAAHAGGEPIAAGFTAEAVADAPAWAHGSSQPGVAIELPLRIASYWQTRADAQPVGTPAWRHAQRQRMASLAAMQDRVELAKTYRKLREHGGVELADIALASSGLVIANDKVTDPELVTMAKQPLVQYVLAGRAVHQGQGDRFGAPASRDGLIGALWSLRATVMTVPSTHPAKALDHALTIGASAPRLRLVAALVLKSRWDVLDASRAWDALAGTRYANIAASEAATALSNRGDSDAAAERLARLAATYDLTALPSVPQTAPNTFQSSRRGTAGWQTVWLGWRERVLAGDSFAQVLSLVPLAAQQPGELPRVLARAVQLAHGDPAKQLVVAQVARMHGQPAWAAQMVEALVKTAPTHDVYAQLAALRADSGQLEGALEALEAAQDAGANEPAGVGVVRSELGQILALAEQLAVQSTGRARDKAVRTALAWGNRWRAVDPGNAAIDAALARVLLAVGDNAGAWRQMSSSIERDPWSSDGYMAVAIMFEQQGKVEAALPYWEEAIRIDQTNPTPRFRKAQALFALGRGAEGDAILNDIAHGKWHDVWSSVVYQARDLLDRGKRPR